MWPPGAEEGRRGRARLDRADFARNAGPAGLEASKRSLSRPSGTRLSVFNRDQIRRGDASSESVGSPGIKREVSERNPRLPAPPRDKPQASSAPPRETPGFLRPPERNPSLPQPPPEKPQAGSSSSVGALSRGPRGSSSSIAGIFEIDLGDLPDRSWGSPSPVVGIFELDRVDKAGPPPPPRSSPHSPPGSPRAVG